MRPFAHCEERARAFGELAIRTLVALIKPKSHFIWGFGGLSTSACTAWGESGGKCEKGAREAGRGKRKRGREEGEWFREEEADF